MKSVVSKKDYECFICHSVDRLECHHIFGGADRAISEKYGLKVMLCNAHHHGDYGAHGKYGKSIQDFLHQTGQEVIEDIWRREGEEDPRARFRKEFRKSYL